MSQHLEKACFIAWLTMSGNPENLQAPPFSTKAPTDGDLCRQYYFNPNYLDASDI